MEPARVITFAGFTGTVREWAQRQGINVSTLHSRIERNMPLARALTMPTQRPKYLHLPRTITYKGEQATIAQWAVKVGLSEMGLKSRLRRGRTIEEALTEPVHPMPARLRKQEPIKATSTVVKCFYCARSASMYHFLKTGVFRGVPLCGSSECVSSNLQGGMQCV